MKIVHFVYDDVENPWCGGGGTYRNVEINKRIAKHHNVTVYSGNFPAAFAGERDGVIYRRLGLGCSYGISRLSYVLIANLIWPFLKAELLINEISVFAPLFSFPRVKKQIYLFYHVLERQHLKKYPVAGWFFWVIERMFLRWTRNLVVISQSACEKIIATSPTKKNARVILSGYDESLLDIPFEYGSYILYFGRFDFYMKGLDVLLDALALVRKSHKDAMLVAAGHASQKDMGELNRMIAEKGLLTAVKVIPNPDSCERQDIFAKARFLVMPSRFEGWGIVAVESAAAGKMCIGSDIDGLRDAIKNDISGFLVPPENSARLAEKICYLLDHPELQEKHYDLCKKWARRFKWDEFAKEQMKFYEEVVCKTDIKK